NGAVFKGNSVIYKIHLPFIQEEGIQKYKLGIGLAHDDSAHSFLVQIYRSDKKIKDRTDLIEKLSWIDLSQSLYSVKSLLIHLNIFFKFIIKQTIVPSGKSILA
ncbi:hypothetical protein JQ310_19505, partial [Leptospira interrogans]|nr:hypothetical protein [Leptospira interrogans]